MSKKVYKKVSFIIPELDEDNKGVISKEVYRKLIKYGKLLNGTDEPVYIDGVKVYVNNEIHLGSSIYMNQYGITILETIYLLIDGSIEVDSCVEGDRIDIEIPFETGITIEDKVASSFDGLVNGNVKFKVWRHGDIVIPAGTEDFSRTFITIVREGAYDGSEASLRDANSSNVVCSFNDVSSPIFSLRRYSGNLYVAGGAEIQIDMKDFEGDLTLYWGDFDTVLLELVVE